MFLFQSQKKGVPLHVKTGEYAILKRTAANVLKDLLGVSASGKWNVLSRA